MRKTQVINIRDRNRFAGDKNEIVQFVFIGRPSKWGNPFRLPVKANNATRQVVIEKYREYLREHPNLIGLARKELKGKVLVCYCSPKPCHGDVLAEIAEGGDV